MANRVQDLLSLRDTASARRQDLVDRARILADEAEVARLKAGCRAALELGASLMEAQEAAGKAVPITPPKGPAVPLTPPVLPAVPLTLPKGQQAAPTTPPKQPSAKHLPYSVLEGTRLGLWTPPLPAGSWTRPKRPRLHRCSHRCDHGPQSRQQCRNLWTYQLHRQCRLPRQARRRALLRLRGSNLTPWRRLRRSSRHLECMRRS